LRISKTIHPRTDIQPFVWEFSKSATSPNLHQIQK
jgi:hypothetical protein